MSWETVLIIISSILCGAIYLYLILAFCGIGANLIRGYCYKCTNRTENNKKEQKYVVRFYVIKDFVMTLFFHGSALCLIFKQFIASIVLFVMIFVSWGIIELIYSKNKKYQAAIAELSDDKRIQLYFENLLQQKDNEKDNEITSENINFKE